MSACAQWRRAMLAEPRAMSPELEAHLASCPECSAYRERLLRFEERLERALQVDPLPRHLRARRVGWLAMAASVLLALIVGGTLWLAAPHSSLAADVVAHMAGEPDAWARTQVPWPAADLDPVLAAAHLRLLPDAGMVSYAQSCEFRGRHVPHLVVQTNQGPITVMVLTHESTAKAQPFDEEGYRGIILPVPGHGSLAVLGRGADVDLKSVEKIAMRVENAIVWTD
jgi:Protein of unknown function (DUF3379)